MADHLVLIVSKAEENDGFSMLKARVNDLKLHKLASEFDWQRTL